MLWQCVGANKLPPVISLLFPKKIVSLELFSTAKMPRSKAKNLQGSKGVEKDTEAKGTKRKLEDVGEESSRPKRGQKSGEGEPKKKMNQTSSNYDSQDFGSEAKTKDGKPWNIKFASWNVDGLRAWVKKGGLEYLKQEQPNILCLQETKCSEGKLPEEVKNIDGYQVTWLSGEKEGYSGVALFSKEKPIEVTFGIGQEEHDKEGRVITAEYPAFYLVNTYVPNAGRGLVTLPKRMEWDPLFRAYLKNLDSKKPVILCGDLNVSHQEIDLANPKTNKRNAGFTQEERDGFSALLTEGFVDSFRHLYPDKTGAYTFWTYMGNSRSRNVGWRLDYFVLSEKLLASLCDVVIRDQVFGSDHCPLVLFLNVSE